MSEGGLPLEASRRDALRRAALGAGGLAAAALLPSLVRPGAAQAQSPEEERLREFLEAVIEVEQGSVLAYNTALERPGLEGNLTSTLELLRDQEQAHANALRTALDSLGFDQPDPPSDPDDVEDLNGLSAIRGGDELLAFLAELERTLIARYLELAPALESEDLARTSAEIAGSHAQHVVVLRTALGDDPAEALGEADASPAAATDG